MPVHLTTVGEGRSTTAQREQVALGITRTHCEVTGAPVEFVNGFFSEHANPEVGFRDLPEGMVAFVNGTIRAGRDDEAKARTAALS